MPEIVPLRRPESLPSEVPVPLASVLRIASEYEQAGRCEDAEELLRAVLRVAPRLPAALHRLGVIAFRQNRLGEAARLLERALAQGADLPLAHRDLCVIYERLGRPEDAIRTGRRATELIPYDPHAYQNLTVAYRQALQLEESIASARRALALDPALPSAHMGLAEAFLLRGDLEIGWEEYEWRFRMPGAEPLMPPTDRPQWDGAPMTDGTLLLVADQGFGDAIQFARYIPWVARRCARVMLACSPPLAPLLQHNFPWLQLVTSWDSCAGFAAFCPLSGLPRMAGTRLGSIPAETPYLRADPGKVAAWEQRLRQLLPRGYRRLGVIWAGRPAPPHRSTSLQALAPVAALDGIALISLQVGQAQGEAGLYRGRAPLVSLGHELRDFMDTAAVVANLDLIVTIDTAVAHLAGAMGKPAWIMLPYAPDWRWLLDREDSPWYPAARLFRQPAPGQWDPVIARVAEALRAQTPGPCARGADDAAAAREN